MQWMACGEFSYNAIDRKNQYAKQQITSPKTSQYINLCYHIIISIIIIILFCI